MNQARKTIRAGLGVQRRRLLTQIRFGWVHPRVAMELVLCPIGHELVEQRRIHGHERVFFEVVAEQCVRGARPSTRERRIARGAASARRTCPLPNWPLSPRHHSRARRLGRRLRPAGYYRAAPAAPAEPRCLRCCSAARLALVLRRKSRTCQLRPLQARSCCTQAAQHSAINSSAISRSARNGRETRNRRAAVHFSAPSVECDPDCTPAVQA